MTIQEAISTLRNGGIVIFPTDTAFGIGCRADSETAVERLFRIRRRPAEKATPVLVDSPEMAKRYWVSPLSPTVDQLTKTYWPGALTIVAACQTKQIPSLVRGGGKTIGLRMPDHQTALQLIHEVGVPILGPSANFSGHVTPFSVQELDPNLILLVDGVVDGFCSPARQASTVIDCTETPPTVLRQGATTIYTE